jgi:hypothetical protein
MTGKWTKALFALPRFTSDGLVPDDGLVLRWGYLSPRKMLIVFDVVDDDDEKKHGWRIQIRGGPYLERHFKRLRDAKACAQEIEPGLHEALKKAVLEEEDKA